MELDNITYNDLSLFQSEEEYSVFHKINFTRTVDGREWLLKFFKQPFNDIGKIQEMIAQERSGGITARADENVVNLYASRRNGA